MQNKIKAIIFDCDGTLIDSEEAHLAAWRCVLKNRGYDLTPQEYSLYPGRSALHLAEMVGQKVGQQESHQRIIDEKRAHYRRFHEEGLPPIEATVAFAKQLACEKNRRGLKLAVASAAAKSEILINLRHLGIEELFDLILSGEEDLSDYFDPEGVNKPKPYIYQHAAKLLGVSTSECVVIEDSMTGIASGNAAGCFTIAIPNRFTKGQDLSAAALQMATLEGLNIDQFFHLLKSS